MLAPRRALGLLGGAKPAAFTDQSLKRLQGINPLLADVLKETERRALESGIKIEVSEGLRDPARQQSLVAQGKSQTLRSKHLTGNAVDVHIRNPDGSANWDFEAYRPVAEIAKAVAAEKGVPDLVWGGDWKTLKDGVHFQIGGASGKPNGGSGMRGGGGLLSMQGNPGADALQPQPQQPKSFMDRTFRDQDWRAKMAIALEGMTLNPNRGLIDVLGGEMKDRRDTKKSDAAKNKTAAWLRSVGQRQLADALETGSVDAGAVVNAALQAMQPPDPMRALQMEKTQLELDQMKNPVQMAPAQFQALDMQAQAAGLQPGTPEYQAFMLRGGGAATSGVPASFQALDLQAQAAGFEPGTPGYRDFMATRGAGLASEARVLGEQRGAGIAGAPLELAQADQTLKYIDEVRNHPGLGAGTGLSSVFNVVPGTPGYDFQNRTKQLTSGAFLTAIDQLRGMGALSNTEGQTATAAITRMDTATSKDEYLAALSDYESIVKQGRDRAAGRLGKDAAPSAPSTGTPSAGGGMPPDFAQKYGDIARQNGITIDQLWEAWPSK
jgi:hypothetical protein